MSDAELEAWFRFVDALQLDEATARRLWFVPLLRARGHA